VTPQPHDIYLFGARTGEVAPMESLPRRGDSCNSNSTKRSQALSGIQSTMASRKCRRSMEARKRLGGLISFCSLTCELTLIAGVGSTKSLFKD
jgi:hypothetical protein